MGGNVGTMGINKLRYSKVFLSIAVMTAGMSAAKLAGAQEEEIQMLEELVVVGTRRTIRTSIDTKRLETTIFDALIGDDIGDIPALSIGEALETLTGASSHRENGGATEVSIRGLGPFLSSSVINGREATNGSGDRSVNFSQFPAELFSKIGIFKTQSASNIEGGVSGQISLDTIKPLDHGKQSIQLQLKGAYNPDEQNLSENERDIGYRGTASYIDQYDLANGGRLGVSLGVQRNQTTNPEQEYRASSSPRLCGLGADGQVLTSGNCDSGDGRLDLSTPEGASQPFVFTTSSHGLRQNITSDERDAVFGAVQWQINDRLDVNFDAQISERTVEEERHDLTFAEARRGIQNLVSSNGIVQSFNNAGRIETLSTDFERNEEYEGFGLNVEYQVTDALSVEVDASYSNTRRDETDIEARLRSNNDFSSDRVPTSYNLQPDNSIVPLFTVTNFDANDHSQFRNSVRIRGRERVRENTIQALKADFTFDKDEGLISSYRGGVRFSDLEFQSFGGARPTARVTGDVGDANEACRRPSFPETSFLSAPTNGQNLITNVDSNGNVVAQGTGSTYATFNPNCLFEQLTGGPINPDGSQITNNSADVNEQTLAAYVQVDYAGSWRNKLVRGNFGLRVIDTEVESIGYRSSLRTITDPTTGEISFVSVGGFDQVVGGGGYTELLPSASIIIDMRDDLLFRGGLFRGISRPDPSALDFSRNFNVQDGDNVEDVADLLGNVRAAGNPNTQPLTSWNLDAALEWYPNADTILAGGVYYKRFQGGFEQTQQRETFVIDGQSIDGNVTTTRTRDNESNLYGFELTATHSFNYLDGFWSGFGAKLSYNYATSDFEFEDGAGGSSIVLNEAGEIVSQRFGVLPPAEIFGLSENVVSAQLYYQTEKFDAQLIYKSRSDYFQQFVASPDRVRFVDDNSVWEVRLSYLLNERIKFSLEGINLFDEPRRDFRGISGNVLNVNSYGPRLFFGVTVKL